MKVARLDGAFDTMNLRVGLCIASPIEVLCFALFDLIDIENINLLQEEDEEKVEEVEEDAVFSHEPIDCGCSCLIDVCPSFVQELKNFILPDALNSCMPEPRTKN